MSQARPPGIGAADPAWPRCLAANCASPAEPARITSGDAMPAAASASRSASVSASAAMMPPAARRSAAPRAALPPRTLSSDRWRTGRAAPRRRMSVTTEVSPGYAGSRPIAEAWAGSPSTRSTPPVTVRPWAGKLEHTSAVGRPVTSRRASISAVTGPRSVESIFLKTNPARIRARRSRATARTRAPASDGESARLSVSTTATARVTSTRAASTNTPTLPRPEKCAPASQAPVRSSAMSVMVMRP